MTLDHSTMGEVAEGQNYLYLWKIHFLDNGSYTEELLSTSYAAKPGYVPPKNYSDIIDEWIKDHQHFPEAAKRGEEGTAEIQVKVEYNGHVSSWDLTKSSGHQDFDSSVKEMIREAVFPPFSAGMGRSARTYQVTLP